MIDSSKIREHRADRHLDRKDEILVYAFMRIWKARERGKLLERVKTVRLLKDAWAVWKRRIKEQRDRQSMLDL
jgi:protein SFI1